MMKMQAAKVVLMLMFLASVLSVTGGCSRTRKGAAEAPNVAEAIAEIERLYKGGSDQIRSAYTEQNQVRSAQLHREGSVKRQQAYEKARQLANENANNPRAQWWFGLTAVAVGREEEAMEAYKKAITMKENYAEAHNNLGDLYERQERWAEAIKHYERAIQINPDRPEPYAGIGDVYRKNGAWKKAVENYEKATSMDSSDVLSQSFLEACRKAIEQEVRKQAPVIIRGGKDVRGLEKPPDTPRLAMHIEFKRDKWSIADMSENGQTQLQEAAKVLASDDWNGKKIAIHGYACSCGSREYNKELARKRAETIRDYLSLPNDTIIIAHGEEDPVADTGDENLPPEQCEFNEKHSMNRRVVVREWRGERPISNPNPGNSDLPGVPPRASAKVSFWWRQAAGGQFRWLKDGAVMHSGDEFKIFMLAYHLVYAYVFHHGSGGDWICLFPNEKFCKEAPARNPLEQERKYWLPRFGEGVRLDNTAGKEETFAYFSAVPDPVLEELARRLKEGERPPEPERPGTHPPTPPAPTEGEEVEEVVKLFLARGVGGEEAEKFFAARGVGGITAQKAQDTYLPANWYARVTFRHEP